MRQSVFDNASLKCYLTEALLDALNGPGCKTRAHLTNQQLFSIHIHNTLLIGGGIIVCLSYLNLIVLSYEVS